MIRAAAVLAVLLALAAVGAALDVGAHRLRHRYRCWRAGRRTVRAWARTRREQAAAPVIAAADIPLVGGDGWDRLRAAIKAEQQPGSGEADYRTCEAIWNLATARRKDTP